MILVFLAMYGVMFLITQYFQLVLGYSPLSSALRIAADGADHDHRGAAHAPAHRSGSARTASSPSGMVLIAVGFLMFRGLAVDTPVLVRARSRSSRSSAASR